ncbi:MAG TPA: hypothetical protein VKX40_03980 [Aequorivita sp.]|nr:hypothetical protein [Aequorivita sp.]
MSKKDRNTGGSERGQQHAWYKQQKPTGLADPSQQSEGQQWREQQNNHPNKQQGQREWEQSQREEQIQAHRPTKDLNLNQESENQKNQDPTQKSSEEE